MGPKLYWIDPSWPGKLAISARPRGGDWLEDEMEGWRQEGVDVVVSLLTKEELPELGLESESESAKRHGLRFMNLPIPDRGVPDSSAVAATFLEELRKQLEKGRNAAIHCRQGIGRSGMIAAALLVKQGTSPSEAMQRVSQIRGVSAPETEQQRTWLFDFSPVGSVTSKGSLRR
jgi:protein-tyrosine phosphatase